MKSLKNGNNLFPVFFKLEQLQLLIVGGGHVGLEKLTSVLSNSPSTNIRLVAKEISDEVRELSKEHPNVKLIEREFRPYDLEEIELVIVGIDNTRTSELIRDMAKARGLLVNVADKPELCDFYLGSVVKKGDLKIAISTNGKSPTVAKRIKEYLNESIPESIDEVLQNMSKIREKLHGNFDFKVRTLNSITKDWLKK
ncbi:bifunctional precorrin-2 dehydrogenase/sirohydrochlorin ferrochelatase [Reichenbachiella carrageenanivorans]|uniref:precorrin-2 dehydrogenase n=1 Tax=Reichenbachiella carrageenanivorans TaxID=2979869 RepID=A0ABY6D2H8_9BACT|nr:bifunctional precorrin-2 dehydrogenase/sirohydrochlorin ferrochelatase [Reichenbachiella carrageenanivorans]UXX80362.1 bifunctional precorrin-2 dehydrogenase/sirohydrochlorin ferrochelatase [Reichenbachiella carrageenanivorans]